MNSNRRPRPDTTTAVEADLNARADFRGINEAGKVHYLLGMCSALLAQANAELNQRDAEDVRVPHDGDCACETCAMERAADTAVERD